MWCSVAPQLLAVVLSQTTLINKTILRNNVFSGTGYVGHATQLAPTLEELSRLEKEAQYVFLNRFYGATKA